MKLPCVLLLDDDQALLRELGNYLEENGFEVIRAADVEAAIQGLKKKPDFVLVDLFLAGNEGAELSNNFIRDHLIPANFVFGRLTSAPRLVPPEFAGAWILDKREVWKVPQLLLKKLTPLFDPHSKA